MRRQLVLSYCLSDCMFLRYFSNEKLHWSEVRICRFSHLILILSADCLCIIPLVEPLILFFGEPVNILTAESKRYRQHEWRSDGELDGCTDGTS